MNADIDVYGNFEGGNPQDPNSIKLLGAAEFAVYPFSEDEDPVYKFRLDVVIANNGGENAGVHLAVHWGDEEFIGYRNVVYLRSGPGSWRAHEGRVVGDVVEFELDVAAGETHVTLNPVYGYGDYLSCVRRCEKAGVWNTELMARTGQGRDIWLFERAGKRAKPTVLILARTHPYETAGSYCAEGILFEIERNGPSRFGDANLFVVPMVCADGVAGGMCKLDRVGGEDLARSQNTTHPVIGSQFELVDRIRPDFVIDFHNWMIPDRDGLFYERPMWMRSFARRMNRRNKTTRRWNIGSRHILFPRQPDGVKAYAQRRWRSRCMTVEFPWRGREIEQVRGLGVDALSVLINMIGR